MKAKMRIDIVSDIVCPWCAVGFGGLDKALQQLDDKVDAEIHWQPFELNPNMPPEGQHLAEHMREKYGSTAAESEANRALITEKGAEVGFTFNYSEDQRMVNTFNAHQLLHWASILDQEEAGNRQMTLKLALFKAYFTNGKDISDIPTLLSIVKDVGLDSQVASQLLDEQTYANDIRSLQQQTHSLGIQAVPTFIFNQKYMVSGGHTADSFQEMLGEILSK